MSHVYITITVDWEGETLEKSDLEAMGQFSQKIKDGVPKQYKLDHTKDPRDIPVTHFFCPAYFSRHKEADADALAGELSKSGAIRSFDEVGLHIHSWKSLVGEAKVTYRDKPTWTGSAVKKRTFPDKATADRLNIPQVSDEGHEIPFGAYSEEDVRKIIEYSTDLIKKHVRNKKVGSFRCGGWMTNDTIFDVLGALDMIDASAIPPGYLELDATKAAFEEGKLLRDWNKILWGPKGNSGHLSHEYIRKAYSEGIQSAITKRNDPISQPAWVKTSKNTTVLEVPDTGILSDYITRQRMTNYCSQAFQVAQQSNEKVFISIGYHQEGASYKDREEPGRTRIAKVVAVIQDILTKSDSFEIPCSFLTVSEVKEKVPAES